MLTAAPPPVPHPYAYLLPLGYQISVLPIAALLAVSVYGGSGGRPELVLCLTLMPATAWLALRVVRGPARLSSRSISTLLFGDALAAIAVNVVLSATSPSDFPAAEASWQYLAGSVVLWTLARGVRTGLALAVVGVPLRAAMLVLAGRPHGYGPVAESLAGHELVLLAALLLTTCGLVLLDLDAHGVRTRIHRSLHDTVLQSLEAMALASPGDADHAPGRLRELRAIAHAEAVALRRELSGPARRPAQSTPGLVEGLVELVAELAGAGLRVQLDTVAADDDSLPGDRLAALLQATREALRNTLKHAGSTEALVRVEQHPDGITVTARDFGVGFDETAADHRPGLGLSESIVGRLADVGGAATVTSRPGQGTSVVMWVPRA